MTGLQAMQVIVDAILAESSHQNLVAASTLGAIWARHIVDSAQLLTWAAPLRGEHLWIDIGSGAGFPGLVIAALSHSKMILVEPRTRRAAFLRSVVQSLGIESRVEVVAQKIQSVQESGDVISARAVSQLSDILEWASGCANDRTRWILPKGRSARDEIANAALMWHGTFHVEQSITDSDSLIIVASGIARR